MYLTIISLLTFLGSIVFLGALRIHNFSKFESILVSFIFYVSLFAIIITRGGSLFLISFFGTTYILVKNWRGLKIVLEKIDWLSIGLIYFLFYLIFFIIPGFVLSYPSEDYLIYERIGYYNFKYGVENTRTFYNVISENQPKIELYHFFEIWAVTLLSKLNGLKFLDNYILVLSPTLVWISWKGMKELLPEKKYFFILILIFLIVIFINPYDVLIKQFDFSIPISGLGGIIIGLKYLLILPILIFVLIQISKRDQTDYCLFSIISFLYILVFPILILSIFIVDFKFKRFNKRGWLYPVFFGIGFVLIYYLLNYNVKSVELEFQNFLNFKLLLKVFIFGVFSPSVLLLFLRNKLQFSEVYFSFFLFNTIIGAFLWVLFDNNIDANQLYRNVNSPLFSLILFLLIYPLFEIKIFNFFVLVYYLCLIFFFIPKVNHKIELTKAESLFLEKVKNKSNVLFFPNKAFVQSVYHYNERFYFKYLKIFYYHSNLDVFNFSSFFQISDRANTKSGKSMIKFYRSISPVLIDCSRSSNFDLCIDQSFRKISVDIIIDER